MQLVLEAGPDLSIYTSGGVMIANFVVRLFSGGLDEIDALIGALHADAVRGRAIRSSAPWSLLLGRSALTQGRVPEAVARLPRLRRRCWTTAISAACSPGLSPRSRKHWAPRVTPAGTTQVVDELLAVRPPGMHHIDIDVETRSRVAGGVGAAASAGAAREIAEKIGRSLMEDGRIALGAFSAARRATSGHEDPDAVIDGLADAAASGSAPRRSASCEREKRRGRSARPP